MSVGDTKSFHLTGGVETLLYTKNDPLELDNKNREPQQLTICAPAGNDVVASARWFRFIPDDSFNLFDGREVSAGDSQTADLTFAQFRDSDRLYVTVDVSCDVHLRIEEPFGRPS